LEVLELRGDSDANLLSASLSLNLEEVGVETEVLGCSGLVVFLGLCAEKFSFRAQFVPNDGLFNFSAFLLKESNNTRSFERGSEIVLDL
jgi:hypothetical protein